MNNYLLATLEIYSDSAKQAMRALVLNWPILIGTVGLALFYLLASSLFGGWDIVGRFILGIIQIILLSIYYSWISQSVRKERVEFKELTRFDPSLFFSVMSVGFVLWIISEFVGPFGHHEDTVWVYYCISLLMFVLFNAVPEFIYLQRVQGLNALMASSGFVKEHWIEWFSPLLIILLLPITLLGNQVLISLASGYPLLPLWIIVEQIQTYLKFHLNVPVLGAIIGVIIANWFMIFRGFLFQELIQGGGRRRAFQQRMKR